MFRLRHLPISATPFVSLSLIDDISMPLSPLSDAFSPDISAFEIAARFLPRADHFTRYRCFAAHYICCCSERHAAAFRRRHAERCRCQRLIVCFSARFIVLMLPSQLRYAAAMLPPLLRYVRFSYAAAFPLFTRCAQACLPPRCFRASTAHVRYYDGDI